jgi:hypothetical protein
MKIPDVVIGATRRELRYTFEDGAGGFVNIVAATVRLQGRSLDLPEKTIDVPGTIYDGPNGIARWLALGGPDYLQIPDLGAKDSALYTLKPKLTDASGLVDWGPEFRLRWVRPPV